MDVLLWIWDGSTDGFSGSLASLGQRIVPRVKVLPILDTVARKYTQETGNDKLSLGTNFWHLGQHRLVSGERAIHVKEMPLIRIQALQETKEKG